ncbi:hypothetical protein [Marinirhabdus gelatinilytica]|uniref:Uncharacterized protein n=1 Tax=Marinirhabdus gelatinilytica TaxID=1703343 RepID=A0A370Q744_9FLAO|nr:hypothetical protein [Marinirhabdus gelatinilytica]RDK83870.1 hypothetical protein C8D94_10683 [Marinirhabdus gelatinilytica]
MKKVFVGFAALALTLSVYSCRETTGEKAEEAIEAAAEDTENNLEAAGEAIEDAAEETEDALEEAGESIENAVEGTEEEIEEEMDETDDNQ